MLHTLQCCTCFRHILQVSIQNVLSVSDVCCKYIYLEVVVAIHICCKRMFINVSPVSNYVAKVLSCCNISGYRKRAHANAVPAGIVVPTARQEKRSCGASTGMWHGPQLHVHQQACGVQLLVYVHDMQAQQLHATCVTRRAGAIIVGRADVVLFLDEWSAFAWEPCMRRKNRCHSYSCM
jgi:hypothetical protein